ncbi:MAG: hypothetical protein IMX01_06615 [Limnochordaceae bacterium]|nr:hypothetical protein [Limnochordaceae bacterium]
MAQAAPHPRMAAVRIDGALAWPASRDQHKRAVQAVRKRDTGTTRMGAVLQQMRRRVRQAGPGWRVSGFDLRRRAGRIEYSLFLHS